MACCFTVRFVWSLLPHSFALQALDSSALQYPFRAVCPVTDSIVESFQHLFSECSFPSLLWNFIAPLMTELRFDFHDDLPARMKGDISKYDPRSLLQAVWSCEHTPSAGEIRVWVRYMWTEIRGVVLKTIWDARCELLHNRNNDIHALQVLASYKLTCTLRLFVLMKTPSRFRDASASSCRSDEVEIL